jgi:recombination protein RecR
MKPVDLPEPVQRLISCLRRLPGVGPKSAERMALWLIQVEDAKAAELAGALSTAVETVRACPRCGFFACGEVCEICADPARETGLLCVVERATDILPLERTRVFKGLYHALGGRIAPLDHIGPGDLRIAELVERVRQEKPDEIILALGADVEGEATASYISDLLKGSGARITRIAQGLPAGGGLDHADDLTLVRALSGRRVFGGS